MKKELKLIFQCLIMAAVLIPNSTAAQTNGKTGNSKIINSHEIQKNLAATEANILKQFDLQESFELNLKSENSSSSAKRYQLQYEGIDVKHMHLIAHSRSNHLSRLIVNNELEAINILDEKVTISAEEAIQILGERLKDKDPVMIDEAHGPLSKLVYYPATAGGKEYILCYEVYLMIGEAPFQNVGYIDASNGRVIAIKDGALQCNSVGTAETVWSGTQKIFANLDSGTNDYTLLDCTRGSGIHTRFVGSTPQFTGPIDYHDDDNDWDDFPAPNEFDQYALDGHWGTEFSFDYYNNNHGVDITNGELYNCFMSTYFFMRTNAAYLAGRNSTVYGVYIAGGQLTGYMTPLDVVGHEVQHRVTFNSADLIYEDESGSLNESYSDIFGVIIQADGGQMDWTMNENAVTFRSLENPNLFEDPDTYNGIHYYTGTNQGVLVHTNSAIINHWFYLVAEGGQGFNDNGENYDVLGGVPIDALAELMYEVLTAYLQPTSNFNDFREAAITAAIDQFGNCSDEVISIINAFHAVGLGPKFEGENPIENLNVGQVTNCSARLTWDGNGAPIYWVYYRPVGAQNWVLIEDLTTEEVVLANLIAGTNYECYATNPCEASGAVQEIVNFTTTQSCPTVSSTSQEDATSCSILISWDQLGAQSYDFNYRIQFSADPYQVENVTTNFIELSDLENGESYEYFITTACSSQCLSTPSGVEVFQLPTCQANQSGYLFALNSCIATFQFVPNPGEEYELFYQTNNGVLWPANLFTGQTSFTLTLGGNSTFSVQFTLVTICPGNNCVTEIAAPVVSGTIVPTDPNPVCDAPANFTFTHGTTPNGSFSWEITWDLPPVYDKFQVRQRLSPTSNWNYTNVNSNSYASLVGGSLNFECLEVGVRTNCNSCVNPNVWSDWSTDSYCPPCIEPTGVFFDDICSDEVYINFSFNPSLDRFLFRYRELGTSIWTPDFAALPNHNRARIFYQLQPNTTYELEYWSRCGDFYNYVESNRTITTFQTADVCLAPTGLDGDAPTETTANLSWDEVPINENYVLQFRQASSTTWTEGIMYTNSAQISNADLVEGIFYRIKVVCNPCEESPWSEEFFVQYSDACIPGLYMSADPNETQCDPCEKDCYVCLFDANGVKLMENGNWYQINWTSFPPSYPYTVDQLFDGQCLPMGPQFEGMDFSATIHWFSIIDDENPVSTIICTEEFTYTHSCAEEKPGKERAVEAITAQPTCYPNPSRGNITINNPGNDILSWTLLDINGRILMKEKIGESSQRELDLSGFSNALYYLKFTNANLEIISIEKLVILAN